MPPRLVMVKQPPCISSSESLPARAFSASWRELGRELQHALLVDVADDRHQQAAIGVDGDADVDVLLEDHRLAGHVDRRVDLRERLERRGGDLERHRRHRQLALRLRLEALAELLAQRLEIGDVGLLVLRDVRHGGPRVDHVLAPSCGGWRASAGARSAPHFEKSGSDRRAGSAAAAAATATVMTCLPWARTSSAEIRPPGPVPLTRGCRARAAARGGGPTAPRAPRGRVSGDGRRCRAPPRRRRGREPREKSTSSPGPLPFGLASPVLPPKLGRRAGAAASARRRATAAGAGLRRRRRPAACGARPRRARARAWPMVTLSPALTVTSVTVPAHRRRHFDRRLVGLELEDALVLGDRVADLDEHVQDVAALDAVAEVGDVERRPAHRPQRPAPPARRRGARLSAGCDGEGAEACGRRRAAGDACSAQATAALAAAPTRLRRP